MYVSKVTQSGGTKICTPQSGGCPNPENLAFTENVVCAGPRHGEILAEVASSETAAQDEWEGRTSLQPGTGHVGIARRGKKLPLCSCHMCAVSSGDFVTQVLAVG